MFAALFNAETPAKLIVRVLELLDVVEFQFCAVKE
jgi:hypothetical protein